MTKGRTKKDTVINMRLSSRMRNLIDQAAEIVGETRTAFILESAHKRAIEALSTAREAPGATPGAPSPGAPAPHGAR
jgi:uncharacterized protein (DUF1778 family)